MLENSSTSIADYYTEDGLLSDKTPAEPSENQSMWLIEEFIVNCQGVEKLEHVAKILRQLLDGKGFVTANPDHSMYADEGFSRDNMIAWCAFWRIYSITFEHKRYGATVMTEMGWTAIKKGYYRYFQPQDIIFFGLCAQQKWAKKLEWFLYLNMWWVCWRAGKTPGGDIDTDGKRMTMIRCAALAMRNPTWDKIWLGLAKVARKCLVKQLGHDVQSNNDIYAAATLMYSVYFKDPNHPINVALRNK